MNKFNCVGHLTEVKGECSIEIEKKASKNYSFIKRVMDIILSIIGLLIGIPLIIIFSILIYFESPGNVIFKQERVGKGAEKNGQHWAQKNDPRVLKIGKFIRKTRIDEIPQLINILKGEMSIVGPRPEVLKFTVEFNAQYPGFINRLQVNPGLTGLAQVSGGYDIGPGEKLKKDLEYIQQQSLWLDIKIILKTIKVIITGDGAR